MLVINKSSVLIHSPFTFCNSEVIIVTFCCFNIKEVGSFTCPYWFRVNIIAILLSISALALLLQGGIIYVLQTMDTYAVATHVNMALINCTLPIMAAAGLLLQLRDLIAILRKPASEFKKADPLDVEAILEKAS